MRRCVVKVRLVAKVICRRSSVGTHSWNAAYVGVYMCAYIIITNSSDHSEHNNNNAKSAETFWVRASVKLAISNVREKSSAVAPHSVGYTTIRSVSPEHRQIRRIIEANWSYTQITCTTICNAMSSCVRECVCTYVRRSHCAVAQAHNMHGAFGATVANHV